MANLVYSKMLDLQATCAYLDHTRLFPFRGCARSKPPSLTALPSLTLFRLTQVYVWMAHQLINLENSCWELWSCKTAKGNLERHTRDRVIPSHSHSDNCVFDSIDHVPPNILNSSHSTKLYIFENSAAVIRMINKGQV